MEIEFLAEGSADCPLVRIYGTDPQEFSTLRMAAKELATAVGKRCAAHELPRFHPVSNCMLSMIATFTNEGVWQIAMMSFTWTLTPAKWLLVAGLVEPFTSKPRDGAHQWLSGREARHGLNIGPISILLSCSANGRW